VLLSFMAVIGLAYVFLRNLFALVMLSGMFSLTAAVLYVVMDAVDVAFTEAAVGAGIATVLGLATLGLIGVAHEKPSERSFLGPFLMVLVTGAVLINATLDMPDYGEPNAPIHHHVAPRYLADSLRETGVPNVVTSVLASYRGFDTLGETTVIFTAACGVLVLLGRSRRGRPRSRKAGDDETAANGERGAEAAE
jgi:multicomponent Na+:H+ antiporter subunit B